jgi:hypothetical protein
MHGERPCATILSAKRATGRGLRVVGFVLLWDAAMDTGSCTSTTCTRYVYTFSITITVNGSAKSLRADPRCHRPGSGAPVLPTHGRLSRYSCTHRNTWICKLPRPRNSATIPRRLLPRRRGLTSHLISMVGLISFYDGALRYARNHSASEQRQEERAHSH